MRTRPDKIFRSTFTEESYAKAGEEHEVRYRTPNFKLYTADAVNVGVEIDDKVVRFARHLKKEVVDKPLNISGFPSRLLSLTTDGLQAAEQKLPLATYRRHTGSSNGMGNGGQATWPPLYFRKSSTQ